MEAPYEIDVTEIVRSLTGRDVDSERVDSIAASIREIGLQTPITVRRAVRRRNGKPVETYEIVAGQHRHRAVCKLQHDTIPCFVTEADDDHAQLWEIDENLMRAELSPGERADYTARRKAIYERLHPETQHGANASEAAAARWSDASPQLEDTHSPSFTEATAEATGRSRQSVERDARRGNRIDPAVMADVRGTRLDKGTYLDALARLSPDEQRQKVDHDMGWTPPETATPPAPASNTPSVTRRHEHRDAGRDAAGETTPPAATEPANPPAPPAAATEATPVADIKARFRRLPPAQKREFIEWLRSQDHGE